MELIATLLMKAVILLAKNVLAPLILTIVVSPTDAGIQKKILKKVYLMKM